MARRPMQIKNVLQAALRDAGVADRVARAAVVLEWADVVGPQIAAVTQARAVTENGTLLVTVTTHAWLTELQLMEPNLLAALNRGRPSGRIRRIVWKVGPVDVDESARATRHP